MIVAYGNRLIIPIFNVAIIPATYNQPTIEDTHKVNAYYSVNGAKSGGQKLVDTPIYGRANSKRIQGNDIAFFIIPDQKEITFYMTFKTAGIIPLQRMLALFFRKRDLILQHIKNIVQRLEFFGLIEKAF